MNPTLNAMIWTDREAPWWPREAADAAVREQGEAGRAARRADDAQGHVLPGRQAEHLWLRAAQRFPPDGHRDGDRTAGGAGAYTFGGLNMAEFAQNPTGHNKTFGDCHNPWNLPYITGGSSSGSGASVAARFNYMALGSDTGGSIRMPASAYGVTRPQADADTGFALRRHAAVVHA